MNKYIVTTTINSPTLATIKYSRKEDWTLIVVGDTKTPHQEYEDLDCIYLSPEYQEKTYPELSETIGWKSIQRRNIGFVEAYNRGADVIATVDDDNINGDKNKAVDRETKSPNPLDSLNLDVLEEFDISGTSNNDNGGGFSFFKDAKDN